MISNIYSYILQIMNVTHTKIATKRWISLPIITPKIVVLLKKKKTKKQIPHSLSMKRVHHCSITTWSLDIPPRFSNRKLRWVVPEVRGKKFSRRHGPRERQCISRCSGCRGWFTRVYREWDERVERVKRVANSKGVGHYRWGARWPKGQRWDCGAADGEGILLARVASQSDYHWGVSVGVNRGWDRATQWWGFRDSPFVGGEGRGWHTVPLDEKCSQRATAAGKFTRITRVKLNGEG